MADENPPSAVLPESVESECVSAEDVIAVAEPLNIASIVPTSSCVAAAPASGITLATSIAPSVLANTNSCRPLLVSTGGQGTQLLRLPLSQFTGRMAAGMQPVRILPPSSVRLLAQASSSGVQTTVGATLSTDASGKQFIICQVSGGSRAIILPHGSINSTRMSGTMQQLATVVQSTGQPVVRGPVLMSASTPNAALQAIRPTSVVVSSSSNLIVTRTMLPQSSIRSSLPTGGTNVQLIQPAAAVNGLAATARPGAGVVLSRAMGTRFSIALAPNTTTMSGGGSTGTTQAGVRLINLRPNTSLPLAMSSLQGRAGIPSQMRLISPAIVTQSTSVTAASSVTPKNIANVPAALVRRLQEMKSAQAAAGAAVPRQMLAAAIASGATSTMSSTSVTGTPLKSVATPTSLVLLQQTPQFVLQSSPAVRGSGSLTQLVSVGKPNAGISQGATVYMITTNNGSNTRVPMNSQALTAALARAKGANIAAAGRPKVVAIPGSGMIRPIVSVSGSNTIFVDARRGNKTESHQTKADRIVAEAIAKAQAEGLCVDILTDGADCKKRRRKKGAEDGDEVGPPLKRKRPPRPRVPGRRGAKDDVADGMIVDAAADGMAVSEECEVLTSEVSETLKTFGKSNKSAANRMRYKKRRPLATFLRNKKKKKGESDTDESDMDTPTGSVVDEDTLQLLQTRRSNRVTKRKKYVDELDLNLSDDDHSHDEDSVLTADSNSLVNGIGNLGGTSTDLYQDTPAEEDSQIVDKILAVRTVKKKVVSQDVDIEGGEDKKEFDKKSSASTEQVEEVDVEEFFVKYKNYSYLHCEWRSADELLLGDKRVLSKIKRFKMKKLSNPFSVEIDEDEPFNPDYVEVERVLDVAVSPDSTTGETVTHYLVSWRSLPYEDSTWELEQDVEQSKIDAFNRYRNIPPPEERQYKPRPLPKDWVSLAESPVYLNDNVLRDYQLEGLNWLTFSYYNRQNCILADEMGLGKTIQSISFLRELFDYGIRGPFLIVVPLSTLGNWQREFESWTDLNAIVYHGTQASRNMLRQYEMYYRDERGNQLTDVYKFHALITTYEVIISDLEELSSIEWRVAIIDEAHRLKNRNCKLLQGLSCFELEHRVLLTGTPLQNNVDELFSLLSFLEPRQFNSSEAFMAEFGCLETETQVDKLKALLKPMMLRRLKEDVEKTLASKEETIIEVELTNIQKKYYRAILERNFSFLSKGGTSTNLPNLMNTMMELRKCCNHPYLVTGAEEQILDEAKSSGNGQPLDGEKLFHWLVQSSGKLVLVDKLLPKLRADGHKVLVFSQMIRVLDIIEDYLLHRHYPYERIDGRIRGNLRQEAIDRFSKPDSDRFVFLLCTRAGGLGINLTAADTVIIFDSDWNPQNDLQAQARCHRIGQLKAVKVYRLITRNTYEREMFDRASLKLGLDKAVLQSTGQKDLATQQNQLSKKEIEDLLKKGAYGALMDDDTAGEEFCEEDIDHILQRRTQIIQIESGVKGSTFAKASFNLSTNRSDINIDDPNFWQKWAKKADIDVNGAKNELIMELPRERKKTTRYGKQDMLQMSELDSSGSDDDDPKKKRKKRRGAREEDRTNFTYSRSECFKVEKNLLVYGWGHWSDIYQHACFKRKLRIDDVITITRAMLLFSLKHYEGDERIKKFIFDLISPSEDGLEKDYKNHSGLSAPVPRGRKGRKAKKDVARKAQFEEDLTKLDIDVDGVLVDEGYKKHLIRQSNKVLLRVRLLYYLKQEVIGRQADKIFDGAPASEIDVPVICADVDIPVYWWDAEADRCLLVGVFKHGYEKFNLMRSDPCLCFLSRCGPPDCKALLAEQNDDDEMKELEQEEEEDEPETEQGEQVETPRRRGRRKKKKRSGKSKKDKDKEKEKSKDKEKEKDIDTIDTDDGPSQSQTPTKYDGPTEDGKLPFPTPSDLNTRFRRIITSFQRCHKQGMLKLEQISKKMHKREQRMERDPAAGSDIDDYGPPPSPSRLPSLGLDGVGSNPLLLAEQLHWTRREEADFYRVVSTFGVERDCETGQFIWDKFRNLAHLERKLDNTLTEYFRAFYHMCLKVCRRFLSEEEARPPNGLYVLPITEERANRCLARIDLLNKVREQILWHPWLDSRLAMCQPSSYLPQWWVCGKHDKDLLIGAAKHGVSHTETNILTDPLLSFNTAYQQFQEHMKEAMAAEAAQSASLPISGESSDAKPAAADVKSESMLDGPSSDGMSDVKTEPSEFKPEPAEFKPEPAEVKPDTKSMDADNTGSSLPPVPMETLKSESDADARLELKCVEGSSGDDSKDPIKLEEVASKEDADEALENDESKALAYNWNYLWPKDRIIFYRLEHICHCIETGRWRMSHRHSVAMNETGSVGTSVPGTPVGSAQDYSIISNCDEQTDSLKLTIHKKRHRRTKAEMEAGKMRIGEDYSLVPGDDSSAGEFRTGTLEGSETPPYVRKKQYRVRRPKIGDDLLAERFSDPDSRVPVVSTDGQILTGDEAPMLRDLDAWLDAHPGFAPLSEVMGSGQKPTQRRRPRLDPTKLAVDQLTGNENVTVVNRNTGKRITGLKAPALRDLVDWLLRNPGFDVDPKWANIVHNTMHLPDELRPRILSPCTERIHHPTSGGLDQTASTSSSHDYHNSIMSNTDFEDVSDLPLQSFRSPGGDGANIPLPVDRGCWDLQPDDSRDDDDDSEDGYSDHESLSAPIPRPVSHLLASQSARMFNSSHPYLCNSNVIDRMCANIGSGNVATNCASGVVELAANRYLSGRDRFVADARIGNVAGPTSHHYAAMSAVDNEPPYSSHVPLSGSGLQPALFDAASDDDAYADESQSANGEEAWQYVEEGEIELS